MVMFVFLILKKVCKMLQGYFIALSYAFFFGGGGVGKLFVKFQNIPVLKMHFLVLISLILTLIVVYRDQKFKTKT